MGASLDSSDERFLCVQYQKIISGIATATDTFMPAEFVNEWRLADKVRLTLDSFEANLSKQQFVRLIWALGQQNLITCDFYTRLSKLLLSDTARVSGVNQLNLKDIQSLLESFRFAMNQSSYDETLIDVLFDKVISAGEIDPSLLVSLIKTCKRGRYNDPKVIKFLFEQTMIQMQKGTLNMDF